MNNNVRIAVMKNIPNHNNFENQTKIEDLGFKNGKNYLIIYLTKQKEDDENLSEVYFIVYSINPSSLNYVFKYSSAKQKDNFPIYSIKENKVNYFIKNDTKNNNTIIILTLNTISKKINNEYIKIPATYIAKVVEKFEVNNYLGSISLGTEKSRKVYKKVYEGNDSSINMTLNDFPKGKEYYIVISAITNEDSSEMFYYNLIKNPLNDTIETDEEKKKKKETDDKNRQASSKNERKNTVTIIILIIILVGLILIFGIWFYKMRIVNKNLRDRINMLSHCKIDQEENEDLYYESINK